MYDATRVETFRSLRGYWARGVIDALQAPGEAEGEFAQPGAAPADPDAVLTGLRRRVISGIAQAKHVYDGVVREPRLVRDADTSLLQAPVLFARCKAGSIADRPAADAEAWEDEVAVRASLMDADAALGTADLVAFGAFVLHAIALRRRRQTDMAAI